MYFIKNIRIINDTDNVSELALDAGLNIIYDPSNTGKSLICECIDFMFGGDAKKLEKPSLKVKSVSIDLDIDGKQLTLYRELKSNQISVSGNYDVIENGTYQTGRGSKKNPPLNSLWLQLMGIEHPVRIYQYMNKTKQSLTVRTFVHTFLINETRLGGDNSILKNGGEKYQKNIPVAALTSLIYLATENNYIPEGEENDDKIEIVTARKAATQELVDLSMTALSESRFVSLPAPRDNKSVDEIQKDIEDLLETIEATENQLGGALSECERLASDILEIDSKIAECKMLENRYSSLRSQYESDIRRLTFIAEGEIHKKNVIKIEYCPFCNGELSKAQSESCVDAAAAEVDKIEMQIADLRSANRALAYEMRLLEAKKNSIVNERQSVQSTIRGELRPKVESLRERLADFTSALEHAKAEELIESFSKILKEKMDEVNGEEVDSDIQFDIRAKVREVLKKPLEDRLTAVLKECNYEHFVGVRFDEDETCDVIVNGSTKLSQGQGFRAFLNTVTAIALQEVIDGYNRYRLPLMLVDSPIMSLKEREEEKGTEITSNSMRRGLFQYMVEHCQCRQTIVIENEIPELDYKNANLIYFTKKENNGRYGLINGYRD